MQVKKQEIKDRVRNAALSEFYTKGYKSTTMRGIALKANTPVALIYTYYDNKADLLEDIVKPLLRVIEGKFAQTTKLIKEERMTAEKDFIPTLLQWPKELVILVDQSDGSIYQGMKKLLLDRLTEHINTNLPHYYPEGYDPMYARILAGCYMESIMTIARNYKNKEWTNKMVAYTMELLFYKAA